MEVPSSHQEGEHLCKVRICSIAVSFISFSVCLSIMSVIVSSSTPPSCHTTVCDMYTSISHACTASATTLHTCTCTHILYSRAVNFPLASSYIKVKSLSVSSLDSTKTVLSWKRLRRDIVVYQIYIATLQIINNFFLLMTGAIYTPTTHEK